MNKVDGKVRDAHATPSEMEQEQRASFVMLYARCPHIPAVICAACDTSRVLANSSVGWSLYWVAMLYCKKLF